MRTLDITITHSQNSGPRDGDSLRDAALSSVNLMKHPVTYTRMRMVVARTKHPNQNEKNGNEPYRCESLCAQFLKGELRKMMWL